MSYIEKVCEFSRDYHGSKMYNHKRNLIQINPKYRKYFKEVKDKHILYVYTKHFEKDGNTYKDGCIYYGRDMSREYNYILLTPTLTDILKDINITNENNESINVSKTYWVNESYDKRAFTHKIANLLGLKSPKELNIFYITEQRYDDIIYDFIKG